MKDLLKYRDRQNMNRVMSPQPRLYKSEYQASDLATLSSYIQVDNPISKNILDKRLQNALKRAAKGEILPAPLKYLPSIDAFNSVDNSCSTSLRRRHLTKVNNLAKICGSLNDIIKNRCENLMNYSKTPLLYSSALKSKLRFIRSLSPSSKSGANR